MTSTSRRAILAALPLTRVAFISSCSRDTRPSHTE